MQASFLLELLAETCKERNDNVTRLSHKPYFVLRRNSDLPDTSYIFFSANRVTATQRKNFFKKSNNITLRRRRRSASSSKGKGK